MYRVQSLGLTMKLYGCMVYYIYSCTHGPCLSIYYVLSKEVKSNKFPAKVVLHTACITKECKWLA